MRILAITNLYPRPGHDTLAPFNRQQFAALAQVHDLSVISPVAWTEELRDWKAGFSVPRHYLSAEQIEVRHPCYYFPPRILRATYGQFFLASIRREVIRTALEFRPDVIFGCWAYPDGWAAVKLARELGIPAVIKIVGSDVLIIKGKARRKMVEGLQQADAVVAVSRHLAEYAISLGVNPDRVHVVYNGLDTKLFHPGNQALARAKLGLMVNRPIVLFIGNLLISKGVGVLVEALARLVGQGLNPLCVIVGRGRDEPKLRAMISRLELQDHVLLVGPKPLEEMPDWYRACDLLALPSFSEGVPNVLLEASACGRPFVATRVGGIPEIAHEATSRLVEPGDSDAVARAIVEILGFGPVTPISLPSWNESVIRLTEILENSIQNPVFSASLPC
jgi:glycosyltransferase involved in cell wall biosynthesis